MSALLDALLHVERLSKSFGGLIVNQDISFTLAAGDRVALIGPNGAGKTTFVNIVAGAIAPASGRIVLRGEDVTALGVVDRARRGLVRTFQITRLFTNLTTAENVTLAVMQRMRRTWRLFASAAGYADIRDECRELLDTLDLGDLADRPVCELAYGQQRLVEIAIGLALRPKVLLLDEPAAGVPRDQAGKILAAIDRLPSDMAVLMIEHDMDLVFRFAKRVLVLTMGRVIFDGSPADVTADQEVRRAYLGNYADARRRA
jgi:branched-chain amino acid transport system ATP-binding protein